jgi:hypothetical protein
MAVKIQQITKYILGGVIAAENGPHPFALLRQRSAKEGPARPTMWPQVEELMRAIDERWPKNASRT